MPELLTPPLALYVHFPWCVRKCPYCDFNSYSLQGELSEAPYLARLERDIAAQAHAVSGREVLSVFLGGGTPSLFSPRSIARLLECVRRELTLAGDAEVTLEANPGTIERGRFAEYRAAGVTRVSLGAQSFDAGALERLGRIHSPTETRRAAEELHAAGIANFNLDLMYALPGQELPAAVRDVEEALALAPAHISHYQLTLEPGTVFAAHPPRLPDDDAAAAMLGACGERLDEAGFAQYEVSAYARSSWRCLHNLNYWNFGDYVGVGAGAHGKLTRAGAARIERTVQPREPRRYLAASEAAIVRREVARRDLPFEFMLNALRLSGGFARELFSERTGLEWEVVAATVAALEGRGLLLSTPNECRATALGLRFLNDVLVEFMPETPEMTGSSALSTAQSRRTQAVPVSLYTGS